MSLPLLCLILLGSPGPPQPCLCCLALLMARTRCFSGEEIILVPARTSQGFSELNVRPEMLPGLEELVTPDGFRVHVSSPQPLSPAGFGEV